MINRDIPLFCPFINAECRPDCALTLESDNGYSITKNGDLAMGLYACGLALLAVNSDSTNHWHISNMN